MSTPNNGLITETNRQYYEGAQGFKIIYDAGSGTRPTWTKVFVTTFNTDLIFGDWDPNNTDYALNNFKLYWSPTGFPGTFEEVVTEYSVNGNTITYINTGLPAADSYLVVQLKVLNGGNYGDPGDPSTYAYG